MQQAPGLYPVLGVCVCVCVLVVVVCVCVWGGGQDVITIRTSIMTPPSATVSRVSTARGVDRVCVWGGGGGGGAVVTNAFYSHNACWYMRALYNNGYEHRRWIKMPQT